MHGIKEAGLGVQHSSAGSPVAYQERRRTSSPGDAVRPHETLFRSRGKGGGFCKTVLWRGVLLTGGCVTVLEKKEHAMYDWCRSSLICSCTKYDIKIKIAIISRRGDQRFEQSFPGKKDRIIEDDDKFPEEE
jgi:hypothetical protein